jgi:thioredoxin-like negative regulator of GroEL
MLKLEDLKQPAFVIFSSKNCPACTALLKICEDVDFDITIINEENGAVLGPIFNIYTSPTAIIINNDQEVSRFYGVKKLEYINRFIEENIS